MTAPARAALLRRFPLVVCTIAVLIVLFMPASATPQGADGSDKLVHATMFAVLAATSRFAGLSAAATLSWIVVFGALSEVAQGAIAPLGRSGSPWDFAADAVGAVLGTLGYAAVLTLRGRGRSTRPHGRARQSSP
ncbi:VanZ family protein [Rhodococcus sp. HNM0569]|uniref:VanZ family protein n=1 Tax=Rhodococcus sp. HNM0569 TaxID=2716340 RepID=UPI00197CF6A2|nr:VanZ family protein [Rhodococcus sp. HNM0569]